jgi:uncharacterized RDD family membrane protein YckC
MTSEAMTCPNCGYSNADSSGRCERCGAQLTAREEEVEAPVNLELPLEDAYTRYLQRQTSTVEISEAPRPRWGGCARRGLAFLTDLLVLAALSSILFFLVYVGFTVGMAAHRQRLSSDYLIGLTRFFVLGEILLVSGYFVLFHGMEGKTPGKWLLGLRVVGAEQRSIGYRRALVRFLGYFPAIFSFGLGILWIVLSREKRGWHDFLAGTWVVREGESVESAVRRN